MKWVHGWYLPSDDDHFEHHLARRPRTEGRGSYQLDKIKKTLASAKRRRTAVDVGAHVGLWTHHLAPNFQKVAAFEPVRELRECFRENVLAENVELYPYALSNTEGEVVMAGPSNGNSGNWALASQPEHEVTQKVLAYSLDDFDFNDVDLIKIDVEGWEVEVVRGAERLLDRCGPIVVVEQKPGHGRRYGFDDRAAVTLLKHWGMHVLWEQSGDVCLGW